MGVRCWVTTVTFCQSKVTSGKLVKNEKWKVMNAIRCTAIAKGTNSNYSLLSLHFHANLYQIRCKSHLYEGTETEEKQRCEYIELTLKHGDLNYQQMSSNRPVSESMIKPRTMMSFGTRGWVLMVSTVFLTDVGVSLNPSSQASRSMPHLRMVSSVSSVTPLAIISWWKWS